MPAGVADILAIEPPVDRAGWAETLGALGGCAGLLLAASGLVGTVPVVLGRLSNGHPVAAEAIDALVAAAAEPVTDRHDRRPATERPRGVDRPCVRTG